MNGKSISGLARMTKIPYRTIYSYVCGEKRPKPETARILAQITGNGTDEETLIWMSKDTEKIQNLMQNWKHCRKRSDVPVSERSECANASQGTRESKQENKDFVLIYVSGEKGRGN